jgi:NH3-dependent NAD+ synthetase
VDELKAEGVEANFVAIRLPYAVQHDEDDAQAVMDFIWAETEWTFNISAAVDGSRMNSKRPSVRKFRTFTRETPRPVPA